MRREVLRKNNPHFPLSNIILKAAGILLMLTLLSIWMVCGMFAKYTSGDYYDDYANVAETGAVSMLEHEAVPETDTDKIIANNSVYTLSENVTVISNSYKAVPGTVIPKDPFIILSGSNDVSCELYIEVVDNSKGCAEFKINLDDWSLATATGFFPAHGGTVYKYNNEIQPGEAKEITGIIESDVIYIKDNYADKSVTENNDDNFSIDFYAYLIQKD